MVPKDHIMARDFTQMVLEPYTVATDRSIPRQFHFNSVDNVLEKYRWHRNTSKTIRRWHFEYIEWQRSIRNQNKFTLKQISKCRRDHYGFRVFPSPSLATPMLHFVLYIIPNAVAVPIIRLLYHAKLVSSALPDRIVLVALLVAHPPECPEPSFNHLRTVLIGSTS